MGAHSHTWLLSSRSCGYCAHTLFASVEPTEATAPVVTSASGSRTTPRESRQFTVPPTRADGGSSTTRTTGRSRITMTIGRCGPRSRTSRLPAQAQAPTGALLQHFPFSTWAALAAAARDPWSLEVRQLSRVWGGLPLWLPAPTSQTVGLTSHFRVTRPVASVIGLRRSGWAPSRHEWGGMLER